ARITQLVDHLVIYPHTMDANLKITRGLIFSEGIMLKLIQKGLSREQAYALVQKAAFRTLQRKKDFRRVLLQDRSIRVYLQPAEIQDGFDLSHSLRYVDEIFRRVFHYKKLLPQRPQRSQRKK
ncbi:MAG: hypothetical protein OEW45_12820, partial [Deltaproteobacteria bacterium]|nr:hypothetical protein [Deltaproteobacteria bacterium]